MKVFTLLGLAVCVLAAPRPKEGSLRSLRENGDSSDKDKIYTENAPIEQLQDQKCFPFLMRHNFDDKDYDTLELCFEIETEGQKKCYKGLRRIRDSLSITCDIKFTTNKDVIKNGKPERILKGLSRKVELIEELPKDTTSLCMEKYCLHGKEAWVVTKYLMITDEDAQELKDALGVPEISAPKDEKTEEEAREVTKPLMVTDKDEKRLKEDLGAPQISAPKDEKKEMDAREVTNDLMVTNKDEKQLKDPLGVPEISAPKDEQKEKKAEEVQSSGIKG